MIHLEGGSPCRRGTEGPVKRHGVTPSICRSVDPRAFNLENNTMAIASWIVALFSVLIPSKMWYAPNEKLLVRIDAQAQVILVMSDFQGRRIDTDVPTTFEPGATPDIRATFPAMRIGTYVLYAIPTTKFQPNEPTRGFVGTPLVIGLRGDDRPGAATGAIVVKVEPLSVAKFTTSVGEMTAAFYYDVAPNTVANFLNLSREGFYDGRLFHRVVPDFVVQTGDPLGDNSGGPGYQIQAEFNGRPHLEGVMSMAREGDPMESQGAMPRPEYANSAGSQFFICLNYDKTKRLDHKYTAFGQVVSGIDVLRKIGGGEVDSPATGHPKEPVKIEKVEILGVTADSDPYPSLIEKAADRDEKIRDDKK